MRLLFITQKVDKDDDVLGVYHRWIEELASKFEKISVICLYQGRTELPANVAVYSLGKEKGIGRVGYLLNFYRFIFKLRRDYDVVFVHMNPEYVILGGLFWKLLSKRIVLWYAHYWATWRLRLAALLADKIVTSTKLAYPLVSGKLEVLQQGIDTEKFKPNPGSQDASKFKILSLGRIAPVKDLETLLQALAIVRQTEPMVVLDIVGKPTPGKPIEQAYYEKIKRLVSELKLEDIVIFREAVANHETPKIYNAHNLFVNLTITGSFDKSTLEAMACGLPVLVSNKAFWDILPSNLADNLIFGEKDSNDLAAKIVSFMKLPLTTKMEMEKSMRGIILEKHSLDKLVGKLYKSLSQ